MNENVNTEDIIEDVDMDESKSSDDSDNEEQKKSVYLPSIEKGLQEGEEWDYDPSAYKLYYSFETSKY